MRVIAATLALLAAGSARAQVVDGHGEVPPAFDPNPRAPLSVQAPWSAPQGAWSALGLLEYVDAPVVLRRQSAPNQVEEVILLDDIVALNVAGRYAVFDRFGVAATVPVFIGTAGVEQTRGGPALGDAHVWAPVGLVLPELATGRGFGLSLVPHLSLPTGAQDRLLGDEAPSIELSAVTGYGFGPVSVDLNLGIGGSAIQNLPNQQVGGGALTGGLALGVHPAETWGLHLETRFSSAFSDNASVTGTPDGSGASAGSPNEILLTFKTAPGQTWGVAGVGRGTNSGIGAARFRGFLGVGAHHMPGTDIDVDAQGFAIRVLDPAGVPIPGAVVAIGGREEARAEGDGVVSLESPKWRKGVEVRADRHETVQLDEPTDPELASMDVVLPWLPFQVPVRVQNQKGEKVDAVLVATRIGGDERVEGRAGSLELIPGSWRVEVEADPYGTQARTVLVEPNRPPEEVEFVLLEAAGPAVLQLTLTDNEAAPVEGARILLDGQPLGTSGGGGLVEVHGLTEGPHALAILHENFTRTEEPELTLAAGDNAQTIVLRRVPGSVKVIARGPTGQPVPDAVVRFDGPSRLPPAPLGARGERIQTLSPGTWNLMVTSAEYGLQQRVIDVPEDSWELIVVEIVLQPGEQGDATLALSVVDPDGHPLQGVTVQLDGKELGTTSTGGAVRLIGLAVGDRQLTVSGETFREHPPVDLFLVEGLQEEVVALDWLAGTVRVTARHPRGSVSDAVLRWIGPETLPPAPLGAGGDSYFQLPGGSWTALATSELYGLQQASVDVPPDSRSLHRIDLLMNPDEGGLADLQLQVVDRDGAPVSGADVLLDGTLAGKTTNTGALTLKGLSAGRRDLTVQTDLHRPVQDKLILRKGEQTHDVVLDWATGAARIRVLAGGQPVTDAVVRMVGPQNIVPSPVDAQGERVFALGPGTWQAVAISAEAGIAQGTLSIAEDQVGLALLDLEIGEISAGTASLLVRVQDPDGAPVEGVEISLGGESVGTTGAGGAILAEGLMPGSTKISATHAAFAKLKEPIEAKLVEGSQERIVQLDWKPGSVNIVATDESGKPVSARVQLVGPVDVEPIYLGANGQQSVALRPGEWQVIASTEDLGPARADVVVSQRGGPQTIELVLEASRVAMTAEAVVIKEQVQFEFGKATLTRESGPVLDEVANAIVGNPGIIKVEIQGHTDAIGNIPYNQKLSQERAETVLRALIDRKVPREKLVAVGYGTQRPIADNETDEGRAKNRRVEFDIVESNAPKSE